jgi:hypothetical protein
MPRGCRLLTHHAVMDAPQMDAPGEAEALPQGDEPFRSRTLCRLAGVKVVYPPTFYTDLDDLTCER